MAHHRLSACVRLALVLCGIHFASSWLISICIAKSQWKCGSNSLENLFTCDDDFILTCGRGNQLNYLVWA